MSDFLQLRNWRKFQHYKDRCPPWIKLHREIHADIDSPWHEMSDSERGQLVALWLIAADSDNKIPNDPAKLRRRGNMSKSPNIGRLIDLGWLEPWTGEETKERWASRYVPEKIRVQLIKDADGRCQSCGEQENLEIDHVVPISQGGTGTPENLQVLCRGCNRAKRARQVAEKRYADAEQTATHEPSPEVETETETEAEQEKDQEPNPTPPIANDLPAELRPQTKNGSGRGDEKGLEPIAQTAAELMAQLRGAA